MQVGKKTLYGLEEVSEITGVKPYVLRFWESEFEIISPVYSNNGQKLYQSKDVDVVRLIKRLLFDEKLTIEKAKFRIKDLIKSKFQGRSQEDIGKKDLSEQKNKKNDIPVESKRRENKVNRAPYQKVVQRPEKASGKIKSGISVNQTGISFEGIEKLAMAKQKLKDILDVQVNI